MSRYHTAVTCQAAAISVAISGWIPLAVLLDPWRRANPVTQVDEIYFGRNLLISVAAALAGLAAGYVLFRLGSQLKPKHPSWPEKLNGPHLLLQVLPRTNAGTETDPNALPHSWRACFCLRCGFCPRLVNPPASGLLQVRAG